MNLISSIIRDLVASIKLADAGRNLGDYLDVHIRPEFYKSIRFDSILKPLIQKAEGGLGRGIDGGIFLEDLVDSFIDAKGGDKIAGLLLSHARERGMGREESQKVIHGGVLTEELRDTMRRYAPEFSKIVYTYLQSFLHKKMLEWVVRKKKEEPLPEPGEGHVMPGEVEPERSDEPISPQEVGERGVPDSVHEVEMERAIGEDADSKHGIIKELLHHFNTTEDITGYKDIRKVRTVYKYLLLNMIKPKSQQKSMLEIAKTYGMDGSSVEGYNKKLPLIVKKYLAMKGIRMPERGISEFSEDVEVPKYTEYLPGKRGEQEDLKGWVHNSFRAQTPSELTLKAIDLFCEGKTPKVIKEETGISEKVIENAKTRYFNKGYESWYRDQAESEKTAYRLACILAVKTARVAVKTARVAVKTVRVPFEKKDDGSVGVKKMHETLVEQALRAHEVRVLITFSALDDRHSKAFNDALARYEEEKKKEPGAPVPDMGKVMEFRWVGYDVSMHKERHGMVKEDGTHTSAIIDYHYHRPLEAMGMMGTWKSSLKVDGSGGDSALKDRIDHYINTEVVSKGLVPLSGHAKFPMFYKNAKTGTEYNGTHKFLLDFDGIFIPDPVHKEQVKEREEWIERKRLGPEISRMDRAEAEALLMKLQREVKVEKDPVVRKFYQENITKLKTMLEGEASKPELDEIERMIEEEKRHRKPPEEVI